MAEIQLHCAYWMFSYRAVSHSAVAAQFAYSLSFAFNFWRTDIYNSRIIIVAHWWRFSCWMRSVSELRRKRSQRLFCWGNPGDANVRINEYKLIKVTFFRAVSPWKCSAIATIKTTTGSLLKYGQHRWIIVKSSSLHRRLSRRVVSGAVIPWPLISMRYRLT